MRVEVSWQAPSKGLDYLHELCWTRLIPVTVFTVLTYHRLLSWNDILTAWLLRELSSFHKVMQGSNRAVSGANTLAPFEKSNALLLHQMDHILGLKRHVYEFALCPVLTQITLTLQVSGVCRPPLSPLPPCKEVMKLCERQSQWLALVSSL